MAIPGMMAVEGSIDQYEVIGLTKTTQLTPNEWKAFVQLGA
jgi:hypothetical protein